MNAIMAIGTAYWHCIKILVTVVHIPVGHHCNANVNHPLLLAVYQPFSLPSSVGLSFAYNHHARSCYSQPPKHSNETQDLTSPQQVGLMVRLALTVLLCGFCSLVPWLLVQDG